MIDWRDYRAWSASGAQSVVGTLKVGQGIWSPQLGNLRDILVYLPPSYGQAGRRYPVIYMQDGQNLFDQATSFAGEWEVDETMEALSDEGIEALIVGIPNTGAERINEYTPFQDEQGRGGKGAQYLAFIVETVKPLIDASFATLPDRAHTGIMGSSLGGLISLYGFFQHPTIFGLAGVMSPSVSFAGGAILSYVKKAPFVDGRIYLDVGSQELSHSLRDRLLFRSRRYCSSVWLLYQILRRKGYRTGETVCYIEEQGAYHHERAWARRLPGALHFLLRYHRDAPPKPWLKS